MFERKETILKKKYNPIKCAVSTCENYTTTPRLRFHGFPKDRERANFWALSINRPDIAAMPTIPDKLLVCEDHFENGTCSNIFTELKNDSDNPCPSFQCPKFLTHCALSVPSSQSKQRNKITLPNVPEKTKIDSESNNAAKRLGFHVGCQTDDYTSDNFCQTTVSSLWCLETSTPIEIADLKCQVRSLRKSIRRLRCRIRTAKAERDLQFTREPRHFSQMSKNLKKKSVSRPLPLTNQPSPAVPLYLTIPTIDESADDEKIVKTEPTCDEDNTLVWFNPSGQLSVVSSTSDSQDAKTAETNIASKMDSHALVNSQLPDLRDASSRTQTHRPGNFLTPKEEPVCQDVIPDSSISEATFHPAQVHVKEEPLDVIPNDFISPMDDGRGGPILNSDQQLKR